MGKKKKRILVLSVCAVLLAMFLIVYHLPQTFQWTGRAEICPFPGSGKDSIGTGELAIDLQMHRRFFGDPSITGSVTVNGKRYVDTEEFGPLPNWYMGGYYQPFVPEKRIEGKNLDLHRVDDDFLIVYRRDACLYILVYHKQEEPFGFIIDEYYCLFVGGIHIGGIA